VRSRTWTLLVGIALLLTLAGVGSALPVPYVALGPGPTFDTLGAAGGKPVIAVKGRPTSESEGQLNLTTVSVSDGLDLASAVRGWLDRSYAVVPRELIIPPGRSREQVDQDNAAAFEESQTSAQTAALAELGFPAQVLVEEVSEDSPARSTLRAGDVLTSVDGQPVTSRSQLVEMISSRRPGDEVTIGYTRGGREATARLRTTASPEDAARAVIGVTVDVRQRAPFTVDFALEDVGGPSAGLMFALGLVDKLTPADLTGGLFIAGTGEIDDDGDVGPIGGIRQKLLAARRAGATVFLVPAGNCAEARGGAPAGLRLVRVQTLDGALSALEQLRTRAATPATC